MISFNAMRNPYLAQGLNLTDGVFRPLFGNTSIIMLLMMPLLTMRLLAEEKKSGTFELLMTYPIRDIETVLGKFFAGLFVFIIMLGLTLVYPLLLAFFAPIEFGPLFASYLGAITHGRRVHRLWPPGVVADLQPDCGSRHFFRCAAHFLGNRLFSPIGRPCFGGHPESSLIVGNILKPSVKGLLIAGMSFTI